MEEEIVSDGRKRKEEEQKMEGNGSIITGLTEEAGVLLLLGKKMCVWGLGEDCRGHRNLLMVQHLTIAFIHYESGDLKARPPISFIYWDQSFYSNVEFMEGIPEQINKWTSMRAHTVHTHGFWFQQSSTSKNKFSFPVWVQRNQYQTISLIVYRTHTSFYDYVCMLNKGEMKQLLQRQCLPNLWQLISTEPLI